MGRYFLGIDGGQSSTTALIGDGAGRVSGYGRAGPCNHVGTEEGRERFLSAIAGCVAPACKEAQLDFATIRFDSACFGFSGGPQNKEALLNEMLRCDRMAITHDAAIALEGANAGVPGLIVIAGTGSIAFGRDERGRTARAGGWGYIFGDEGGGFDIARQALRAALRYDEGWGEATELNEMLLEQTRSVDANEVLHKFYTSEFPREKVAKLAMHVDSVASFGDPIARIILDEAGKRLADLALAVLGQLFPDRPARVSYVGGVFRSAPVLQRFTSTLMKESNVKVAAPVYGPATGALMEAYRVAGLKVELSGVPEVEKQ